MNKDIRRKMENITATWKLKKMISLKIEAINIPTIILKL
jgi:hypothetical protein